MLYIMCGIPGSGKTSFAQGLSDLFSWDYISSDEIRSAYMSDIGYGDYYHASEVPDINKEEIENIETAVWKLIRKRMDIALKTRENVIFDATNTVYEYVKEWIDMAEHLDHDFQILIIDTPYNECLKRNQNRERAVPEVVLERMDRNMKKTVAILREDYPTNITTLRNEQ